MKQSEYINIGKLHLSFSCGKIGDVNWDGTPSENAVAVTPCLHWRKDLTVKNHPTTSIAFSWVKWFGQMSFAWG